MDKETLSNYGWIVICVLVLAVMIALATPFGTFVADAVKSTTQGLFDVNQNALNSTGLMNIDGQEFNSCDHNYEVTTTGDCSTGQVTTTQTCNLCGKTSSETNSASHVFDNASDMKCNTCNASFTYSEFKPNDYDAKFGTTMSTDEHIVIPETFEYSGTNYKIQRIGMSAFEGSVTIKSVIIPNSVKSIGTWAFDGCTSLESVVIPDSVTDVARYAFRDCTNLTSITYTGTIEQWEKITFQDNSWKALTPLTEIICSDGIINLS